METQSNLCISVCKTAFINWKTPDREDADHIFCMAKQAHAYGSDSSYANMYLLRKNHNTEISFRGNFLLRKYNDSPDLTGYGFPLGSGDYGDIFAYLDADAEKRGIPLSFDLLSEEQKRIVDVCMPGRFSFIENRNCADYIYSKDDLATLPGSKYHKKKNHISQFMHKYSRVVFSLLSHETKNDMISIAHTWFNENDSRENNSLSLEQDSIKEALLHSDELRLKGGILYADGKPAAMTIASLISPGVYDTHYEKAIGQYAKDGAYAVINNEFAKTLSDAVYINREEDLGIEGLRHAKESYHPAILFKKYQAVPVV